MKLTTLQMLVATYAVVVKNGIQTWMKNMGDIINGNYDMHTNTGLNVVKSYCDLAIKRTC